MLGVCCPARRTVTFAAAGPDSEPTPNLLDHVGSYKGVAVLPEGAADELDLATEANGTGPFTLGGMSAGGVTLTAFDDHWGEGGWRSAPGSTRRPTTRWSPALGSTTRWSCSTSTGWGTHSPATWASASGRASRSPR